MLTTIRQRNFALLWFAGLISLTGDWVLQVALPFYVYQITGSALSTGLMLIARSLPGVLLSSFAGVFVDRWDRKRTMLVTNLLQGLLLLLLLTVDSIHWLWVVYLVAFGEAVFAQFFGPAENALLPNLVAEKYLIPANALNALNNSLAMLIGPALGGVIMGWVGLTGVVLVDSASFFIAGVLIALIHRSPGAVSIQSGQTRRANLPVIWSSVVREWLEGLREVKTNRLISVLFICGGCAMLGEGIFSVLLYPFVNVLQGGVVILGWLLTIRGLGGLLGGFVASKIAGLWQPSRVFALSLGSIGVLLLIMYNFPAAWVALGILFLIGMPAMNAQVTMQTLFQTGVPDQLRGRIFGAFGTTVALLTLLGQGLASLLGDRVGIVSTLNLAGLLYLLAGIAALFFASAKTQPANTDL